MTDLYTQAVNYAADKAFHGERVKRNDLIDLLREVAEQAEQGKVPTYEQLGAIYSALIPPVKITKPKTAFQWVAMACASSKDIRYYLRYVSVTEKYIAATDGHRMHIIPNSGDDALTPGLYYPDGRPTQEDATTYPDVTRVIPHNPGVSVDLDKLAVVPIDQTDPKKGTMAVLSTNDAGKPAYAVNAKYLKDALSWFDNPTGAYSDSANTPLLVSGDNGGFAVIMPIRC